jgi:hypothetical protein
LLAVATDNPIAQRLSLVASSRSVGQACCHVSGLEVTSRMLNIAMSLNCEATRRHVLCVLSSAPTITRSVYFIKFSQRKINKDKTILDLCTDDFG